MTAADVRFYRAGDEDPATLTGRTVAVIGYGNLGRSVALNLRDSGVAVIIGNSDDEYRVPAAGDGFTVVDIAEAAAAADVLWLLIPDEEIPEVFAEQIAPNLARNDAVCFASGYVLAFGLVEPEEDVDVLLLAPRMLGEEVRRSYLDGTGFLSYVSVERDASATAQPLLLALAGAVGSLRRGAMELPQPKRRSSISSLSKRWVRCWVGR